eukprot:Rhum_TRINITY_DN12776_c1_g1::Rhum_TRINITY_DN12776_c1_g1_i1::g.54319::m.54319
MPLVASTPPEAIEGASEFIPALGSPPAFPPLLPGTSQMPSANPTGEGNRSISPGRDDQSYSPSPVTESFIGTPSKSPQAAPTDLTSFAVSPATTAMATPAFTTAGRERAAAGPPGQTPQHRLSPSPATTVRSPSSSSRLQDLQQYNAETGMIEVLLHKHDGTTRLLQFDPRFLGEEGAASAAAAAGGGAAAAPAAAEAFPHMRQSPRAPEDRAAANAAFPQQRMGGGGGGPPEAAAAAAFGAAAAAPSAGAVPAAGGGGVGALPPPPPSHSGGSHSGPTWTSGTAVSPAGYKPEPRCVSPRSSHPYVPYSDHAPRADNPILVEEHALSERVKDIDSAMRRGGSPQHMSHLMLERNKLMVRLEQMTPNKSMHAEVHPCQIPRHTMPQRAPGSAGNAAALWDHYGLNHGRRRQQWEWSTQDEVGYPIRPGREQEHLQTTNSSYAPYSHASSSTYPAAPGPTHTSVPHYPAPGGTAKTPVAAPGTYGGGGYGSGYGSTQPGSPTRTRSIGRRGSSR